MAERRGSVSGLNDEEAQEFHQFWVQGFVGFTAVAVVAHILVWIWRPGCSKQVRTVMTTQAKQHPISPTQELQEDRKSYWLLFVAAFSVFLALALVGQTLGLQWRSWLPGAEGVKSVTGGVKAAVYTFMSHLN